MSTFASRLKAAMDSAIMRQTDLCVKTGFSKSGISQYLSGKARPNRENVKVLADALGVTVDYLMGDEEIPEKLEPTAPPCTIMPRVNVRAASRCLGKSSNFIRIGLQRGILPFGSAVPGPGKRFMYYISPVRFREYVGAEVFDQFFNIG